MTLAPLLKAPPLVWLAPQSGVQFIDLGFRLAGARDLVTQWSFWEGEDGPQIVGRGGAEASGRVSYEVDWRKISETFARVWVPIPFFRRGQGAGHEHGPVNWARAYLAPLMQPDDQGNDHRLVVAFDTELSEMSADHAYLAPTTEDAQRGAEFSLAAAAGELAWFAGQSWVKEWCRIAFIEMIKAEERRRGRAEPDVDDAAVEERLEGPQEDVARYIAYVELMQTLRILPAIRMIDRVTKPTPDPIDVDLVLDIGNSRTCGLLVETQPNEPSADVTQAVKLQLRDLSRPENVYADPFDSRLEFNKAAFGWDDISFLSGRSDAFAWPTVARVGVEAARLSSGRRGSEGSTGMSSPKRYLWDLQPRREGWRFNAPHAREAAGYATGVEFTTLINDLGAPLHTLPQPTAAGDDQRFPAIRALYARSHLMTFALAEILLQVLCMMNSPAHRLRRPNGDLPRRLRRIIMTVPTGMPLAERQILSKRAEAARDLIFVCQHLAAFEDGEGGEQTLALKDPGEDLPEVIMQWDEASATQAAFLYSRVAMDYSGDARAFFARSRLPMNAESRDLPDDFRLATIDIGGGTTDLVVTAYRVEGQGANVTMFPEQILRDGISIAGDDVVQRIVVEHILERIGEALEDAGLGQRVDDVMHRLFGGDRGDMDVEEQTRRHQFAAHIGQPMALAMIGAYEQWNRLSETDREEPLTLVGTLGPDLNLGLIARIDAEIARLGAEGFSLKEIAFPVSLREIDRTVRSVLTEVLRAMAELVRVSRADLLIVSGRPSRMPGVVDALAETCVLPPHRILPLHEFRAGQWYPFRDYGAKIADPKTTAAVGAMICMLGEGRLRNFNYRSDSLQTRSTARFFGKLDQDNRLSAENVFFGEMDLDDPDYDLPAQPFEFRGPMSLGTRQFGAEWWPGTRLYSIDYQSPDAAAKLNKRTPLKIELQRASGRAANGVVDAFSVRRVQDAEGRSVSTNQIRLWLQTIDHAEGYWLDTGVLLSD
ncbi:MAG: virulence factor SrfB [Pseudomonadota bacterium]